MSDKKPSEIIREKAEDLMHEGGTTWGVYEECFRIALLEYLDEFSERMNALVERYENSTLGDQNRILFLEQRLDRLEKKG